MITQSEMLVGLDKSIPESTSLYTSGSQMHCLPAVVKGLPEWIFLIFHLCSLMSHIFKSKNVSDFLLDIRTCVRISNRNANGNLTFHEFSFCQTISTLKHLYQLHSSCCVYNFEITLNIYSTWVFINTVL